MIINFADKCVVSGLAALKYLAYIVSVPFVVVFMIYGTYFSLAAFLWIILFEAAAISALLIFTTNAFMFFVAIFDANLWVSMGNMWNWLWNWFASGSIALWPHIAKSFLPFFISGTIVVLFFEIAKRLDIKVKFETKKRSIGKLFK